MRGIGRRKTANISRRVCPSAGSRTLHIYAELDAQFTFVSLNLANRTTDTDIVVTHLQEVEAQETDLIHRLTFWSLGPLSHATSSTRALALV